MQILNANGERSMSRIEKKACNKITSKSKNLK